MVKEEKETKPSGTYDASKITVLEGLAPVRKRPGMYIGGTGVDGLHHLVWEVLDNAIDEAMAGFCTKIDVTLYDDGSVSVEDNGRGIPVDKMKSGKSALETVLTVLHAGGKFGDGGYKVSAGLHGVGVSVVNALSVWVKAYVKRDGKLYFQEFRRGDAVADIKVIEKAEGTGTKIIFMPDDEIFTSTTEFSFQTILNRCRQQAYLTKGVMIIVKDERENSTQSTVHSLQSAVLSTQEQTEESEVEEEEVRTGRAGSDEDEAIVEKKGLQEYSFYFEGGISSYVLHLNKNKTPLNNPPMYVEKEQAGVMVELSLAYTDDFKEHIYSFANNINTPEGGTHLTGLKTALT
ncbi:MAG TPA: ATP-binding protein, partial [Patescibacteria group bacterium]|nr:ATP-binding protein [Patescibacteria group bacterium]